MLREQKTINQIASEFGVHPQLIYHWRDQVIDNMAGLFSNQPAKAQAEQELAHQRQVEQLLAQKSWALG